MSVGPMWQSERQEGITGLETAIILIAFAVVAFIFAFTVLSVIRPACSLWSAART